MSNDLIRRQDTMVKTEVESEDSFPKLKAFAALDRILDCEGIDKMLPDYGIVRRYVTSKSMSNNEMAYILAELFYDNCACNYNDISDWLPLYCDFADTCCPNPGGVACWEQMLKYWDRRKNDE